MSSPDTDVSPTFQGSVASELPGDESHSYNTSNSANYETRHQRSLNHYLTRERLPKESHYKNLNSIVDGQNTTRPTLDDLHKNTFHATPKDVEPEEGGIVTKSGKVIKFGWKEGVFMRCLLNIWGVILFLRVSWMVGQAGLWGAIGIITLANIVTMITTISMSAVATNGLIKAGGIYYMISRALGPEFGGSIGLMFTVANSIGASTYIIGFVNGLQSMILEYWDVDEIIPGAGYTNDVRIIGTITLIFVIILAIVGMDWVTRVQLILLFVLIGAHINFMVGVFIGPMDDTERSKGFVGFDSEVFEDYYKSDYRYYEGDEQSFFSVFGVFFPAVTGIVAGANLSGDLKDPAASIPKGTILAICVTYVSYIFYAFLIASSLTRDATGDLEIYTNYTEPEMSPLDNPNFNTGDDDFCSISNSTQESICLYGSENDFNAMSLMASWGPLIYMGLFAATLSSAIASIVGAPRVLQALAKDRLYPLIHVFEKGYGANNDPVRGYLLVTVLSFACIMIGDLNAVSTLLTNFFLAAYSLINFSCFHASFINSPGWRPSFKYYNLWISLLGGFLCIAIMFLIDWPTALITIVVAIMLFMYVNYRKPDVNWGSSTQAQSYLSALKSSLDLLNVEEHVKNYRPQILVMSGTPSTRPPLIDFAHSLTKGLSFLALGNVVKGPVTQGMRNYMNLTAYDWISRHKVKAFYSIIEGETLDTGAKNLYQLCGLGKLRPNMVLLGYKANWNTCDRKELRSYFHTLHEALDMYLGIAILRTREGLDFSKHLSEEVIQIPNGGTILKNTETNGEMTKTVDVPGGSKNLDGDQKKKKKGSLSDLYRGPDGAELPKDILAKVTKFQRKQKNGIIDVWWLYDDGGLTLLLPYILSTRSQWQGCKLRVFALANRKDDLDMEQRSMANLLAKFRIDFSDMILIPDMAKKAKSSSKADFEELISDFRVKDSEDIDKENEGLLISDVELLGQREKTNRNMRLRELLLENSMNSSLIVMTLPMPRKNSVSAPLYMAWLETLTKDMPPFLLIRGNQTSVLTFNS